MGENFAEVGTFFFITDLVTKTYHWYLHIEITSVCFNCSRTSSHVHSGVRNSTT